MSPPSREDSSFLVNIEDLSNQGEGIAHREGKVLFVPYCLPGERVRVRLTAGFRDFDRGTPEKILKKSPDRVSAPCTHFGECGGCQLQHFRYEAALEAKRTWLEETFRRVGRFECSVPPVVASEPYGYRNKVRFFWTGSSDHPLGFKCAGQPQETLPISECHLPADRIRYTFGHLTRELGLSIQRGMHFSFSELTLQETERGVAVVIGTREMTEEVAGNWTTLLSQMPDVTHSSLIQARRGRASRVRILEGEKSWVLPMGQFRVPVAPGTFHQVNSRIGEGLYRKILEWSGDRHELAAEAYSGSGALALELGKSFRQVLAADGDRTAVGLARGAGSGAGMDQVTFHRQSAERFLFSKEYQARRSDVLILDPPRAGCSPRVLQGIMERPPRALVLVSCHPAALARDISRLKGGKIPWEISAVQAFDMFPQTYHMEVATLLRTR